MTWANRHPAEPYERNYRCGCTEDDRCSKHSEPECDLVMFAADYTVLS